MDIGSIFDTLLVHPMMFGLAGLAQLTGSAGLAIILFTIFIRALLLPLSIYQSRSQKALMALQPELRALQKKYGKDRERLTQETMRLYREHGVNPVSGCLPLLLQLPVFYGLYFALINLGSEGPQGLAAFREPFLWLSSLAKPDAYPLVAGLSVPGILPIFMAVSQFLMSKMLQVPNADPQMESMNRMMLIFMPLMLLFFGVTFPSGLVLYWAVSNVFSIVQQGFVTGWGSLLPGTLSTAAASSTVQAPVAVADEAAEEASSARRGAKSSRGMKGKRRGKR